MEYNNDDVKAREEAIFRAVTGWNGGSINDAAVNEKQIRAIFETLETALAGPQDNWERVISWTDETSARLRYGASFVSAHVSLGTEHYILAAGDLLELYTKAREKKLDSSLLDILYEKYLQTEYRNNPGELQRQTTITHLDPVRHATTDEARTMFADGLISRDTLYVKLNLSTLLMKFERENAPVTEFGTALEFHQRIDNISEALIGYAEELMPEEKPESPTKPEEEPEPFKPEPKPEE